MKRKFSLKTVLAVICITMFATSFLSYVLSSNGVGAGRDLYFDDLPSTASYVINTDGTYIWATRYDGYVAYGDSANRGGVDGTNSSAVINACIGNLTNGQIIFFKNGTYVLGSSGIVFPDGKQLGFIGENREGVTFTYSGTDWAIKSANTVTKTGYYLLQDFTVETSNPSTLGGGILINYPEQVTLNRITCTAVGKISGSAGFKIHEISGNQVLVQECSTSAFDYGFWVTADWVTLWKCNSYSANEAFRVSSENTASTRPIETTIRDCLAYHFYTYGYRIVYALGFNLDHCAIETGSVTPANYCFSIEGVDSTAYGYLINPVFHDDGALAASKRFDFSATMQTRVWISGKWLTNSGTATNSTATTFVFNHGLAGTPTGVWSSFNTTAINGWTWIATSTQITITVTGTLPASMTAYWNAIYKP